MFEDLVNIYDDFTKNERTQSLSRFAIENDFDFIKKESFGDQLTFLRNFKLFEKKGIKRFLGIIKIQLREDLEGEIRFYDYLKTKDLETTTTSVVELSLSSNASDYFLIKPRNLLGKSLKFASKKNLRKQFYKRFKVDSSIELNENVMDLLLQFPKITVENQSDIYLFYRKNKQFKISEILKVVDFAEDFVAELKKSSYDDYV